MRYYRERRSEWSPFPGDYRRRRRDRYDTGWREQRFQGGGRGFHDDQGADRYSGERKRREERYAEDYWWLGEHALGHGRYGSDFADDERFRRFSQRTRPRYSPVGGMYPPMGGSFLEDRTPGPLRESTRFSEWTRWF